MLEAKFVLLDLFWDSVKNGGSIREVDPKYNEEMYWWICYNCGKSYKTTVERVLLDFKMNKYPQMNNYCYDCKLSKCTPRFSYSDFLKLVQDKDREYMSEMAGDFLDKEASSYTFHTYCAECGEFFKANQGTIKVRGRLICRDCYSRLKFLKENGSIAELLPEIVPYYSSNNKIPIDRLPVKGSGDRRKILLTCPTCGKDTLKRMDAVIRSGAYCGPCAKHKTSSSNGNSLFDLYPEVAKMFDGGNNTISSKEVSPGSHREYNFLCTNKGIPHIFKKEVSSVVSASKRGNIGCPVCQGFEVQEGVNDFKTRHASMSALWDYDKNSLKPTEVYYRSQDKFWFRCDKGHSFQRDLSHIIRRDDATCPVCNGRHLVKGVNDLETLKPDIAKYWDYELNNFCPDEVTVFSNRCAWFKCANDGCGESFYGSIDGRSLTLGYCDNCRKRNWSVNEKKLAYEIRSWGFDVDEEVRLFGGNVSYDIYIPSEKLAIEYNGLYWHSDKVRGDKNYHYNKYKECADNGIQLVFVWDDDFLYKRDIVLNTLKRKLGVSNERRVNARDCIVSIESFDSVKDFLNNNHIQGSVSGSLYLVLRENETNEIVAVGVFQFDNSGFALLKRYCTNCMVRGGFSKILKYVESNYNIIGVETFSDNGISDGSLYSKNGFIAESILEPDYSYVYKGRRYHKFNFRLERFRNDKNLVYIEGLSERELAEMNELIRVWDAGKVKWRKYFS